MNPLRSRAGQSAWLTPLPWTLTAVAAAVALHAQQLPLWVLATFALLALWRVLIATRRLPQPSRAVRMLAVIAVVLAVALAPNLFAGIFRERLRGENVLFIDEGLENMATVTEVRAHDERKLYLNGQLVLPKRYIATQFSGMLNYLKVGLYRNDTISQTGIVYHDGWMMARKLEDVLSPTAVLSAP